MHPFEKDTYYREKFTGLALNDATVKEVFFEECTFEACSFITCRFERLRFLGCRLEGCVLSAVTPMNCRFEKVDFTSCKVIGIDWTRTLETRDMHFRDCQLNYSNFRFLDMPGLEMVGCEVKDADFIETRLKKAVFRKSDLEKTRFFKADLTEADFREAVNYYVDPTVNTLKKTRFSLPEVVSLLNAYDIIIE